MDWRRFCGCLHLFWEKNGAGKKSFNVTPWHHNKRPSLVFVSTFLIHSIHTLRLIYAPAVHTSVYTHTTRISMTLHHPHTSPFFLFQGAHGESPESAGLRRTWAWPNSFPWLWTWAHQLLIFLVLFLYFFSAAYTHLRPSQLSFPLSLCSSISLYISGIEEFHCALSSYSNIFFWFPSLAWCTILCNISVMPCIYWKNMQYKPI